MATIATGLKISIGNTPQAKDDVYGGLEDFSQLLDVLCNDLGGAAKAIYGLSKELTIEDGGTVTAASMISGVPAQTITTNHGSIATIVDGKISYATNGLDHLPEGEQVTDTFSYIIRLSNGAFSIATVTVTLTGSNDVPVAQAFTGSTDEDNVFNGQLVATDVDDGETATLTYAVAPGETLPAGVVLNPNGSFSVTPLAADQGLDTGESRVVTFNYVANDGTVNSALQTATITINGLNDAPVAQAFTGSTDEDNVFNGQLVATDVDVEGLTYAVAPGETLPAGVVLNPNGSFSVTPLAADQGLDTGESRVVTFNYVANDGTVNSALQTATITINGLNDAPVAQAFTGSTDEDNVFNGQLVATDVDVEGLTYAVAPGETLPAGVVLNPNGSFSVTPLAADQGLDTGESRVVTFNYVANDGTVNSALQTATITINGLNDAPVETRVNDATNDQNFDFHTDVAALALVALDTTNGTPSADLLVGTNQAGTETINGNNGNDIIHGAGGNDNINGNNNDDTLYGGTGNDTINGGGGSDVIYGGSGDDNLNGDGANETIYGGSGNDNIRGNAGTDQLWGGTGQDDFIFVSGESTVALRDRINDFSHAEDDNIDLTAFGNFAATDWVGVLASPAALTAGSLGYVVNVDGSLTIYGDHDGNGVSDFALEIIGVGSLQTNDFIFGGP